MSSQKTNSFPPRNCDGEPQMPAQRPFFKSGLVLLTLSIYGLIVLSHLLNGCLPCLLNSTLGFGSVLALLYVYHLSRRRNLSSWWGLVAVSPLVLKSLLDIQRPFGLVSTVGYILFGFGAVLAIHLDRKRRERARTRAPET